MAQRYACTQESTPSGPTMWPDNKGEWVTYEAYDLKVRQLDLALKLLKEKITLDKT